MSQVPRVSDRVSQAPRVSEPFFIAETIFVSAPKCRDTVLDA